MRPSPTAAPEQIPLARSLLSSAWHWDSLNRSIGLVRYGQSRGFSSTFNNVFDHFPDRLWRPATVTSSRKTGKVIQELGIEPEQMALPRLTARTASNSRRKSNSRNAISAGSFSPAREA